MSLFLSTIFSNRGKKRTLIIVPTLQLIEQTYNDFIEYGISESDISKWSGTHQFKNTNIIIAGLDILQSSNSDLTFLKDIQILLVDEVHVLKKDNLITRLIDDIHTDNKYGFTGTLPEEVRDQWNIFGKIGRVIFEKSSESLREGDFISQVKVNIIKIEYNTETNLKFTNALDQVEKNLRYNAELEFCIDCEFRNSVIALLAKNTKNNTLIMVDRIIHGEILERILKKETNKKVFFIQGSVEVDDREIIKKIMEENIDVICIAMSRIFSTGISIKNIHNIIFCTAGKAKVKLIQSIGRGLRLHKSKHRLTVYDIADNFKYAQKHFRHRILHNKSASCSFRSII
jgi:superfamily II DNA or RNA helicase